MTTPSSSPAPLSAEALALVQAALATCPVGAALVTLEAGEVRLLDANAALVDGLGLDRAFFLANGRTVWLDEAGRAALIADVAATGRAEVREVALRGAGGRSVPHLVSAVALGGAPLHVLVYAENASAAQEASRRVADTEAGLLALVENTPDIIASYDRDLRLVVFNTPCAAAYRQAFGVEISKGLRTLDLFPPEQRGFWEENNRRALSGETFTVEFDLDTPEAGVRTYESSFNPIRQAAEIVGFSTFTRDVTSRKRAEAERQQLEARLRQAQKLEAIGTLAGGIAHDFNNVLHAVRALAGAGQHETLGGEPTRGIFDDIVEATARGAALVRQLLDFTRPSGDSFAPTDLAAVLQGAVRLLRGSIPSTVEIHSRVDRRCPLVLADATQIHQVVMNLGVNAYQALPGGVGAIEIHLGTGVVDGGPARQLGLAPGAHAILTIADSGHGMDPTTAERIFDPFFSTKPKERNTGLGLAVVHGIVKRHRGAIRVTSAPGAGARFEVFLPALEEEPRVAPPAPASPRRGGALPALRGRVLLVDDDAIVLRATTIWLESLGCEVEGHGRSLDAWAAFQGDPDRYGVVMTDQTMPGLTGLELLKKIRVLRPGARVILLSGFSDRLGPGVGESLGAFATFEKPAPEEALAAALARALAGPG